MIIVELGIGVAPLARLSTRLSGRGRPRRDVTSRGAPALLGILCAVWFVFLILFSTISQSKCIINLRRAPAVREC